MAKRGNDVTRIIYYFYKEVMGYNADATQYKAAYTAIDKLMHQEEENIRGYTEEDMERAIERLSKSGLVIDDVYILLYPGLVSALLNDNPRVADSLLAKLRTRQINAGLRPLPDATKIPDGW